jgi:hypothetical protein
VAPWVMITIAGFAGAPPTFQARAWRRDECCGRCSESTPARPPDRARRRGRVFDRASERSADGALLVTCLSEKRRNRLTRVPRRPPWERVAGLRPERPLRDTA